MDVARLKRFFLSSAAKTYAGGEVKKETISGLPGFKVYRVVEGDLEYIDMYGTNGEYSGGMTTIIQSGGRGFRMIWQTGQRGLVYHNLINPNSSGFRYFQGREYMDHWPEITKEVFWHEYSGMLRRSWNALARPKP
ncbi:MAG: hypothetical protein AAB599_02045 [Patescibacteria group bacterium]